MRGIYCLAIMLSLSFTTAQASSHPIPEPFTVAQMPTYASPFTQIAKNESMHRRVRVARSTGPSQGVRVQRRSQQPWLSQKSRQRNVYVNVQGRNMRQFIAGSGTVIVAGAACYREPYGFGTVQNSHCCFFDALCFNAYYIY